MNQPVSHEHKHDHGQESYCHDHPAHSCCAAAPAPALVQLSESASDSARLSRFRIEAMDCPTEQGLIQDTLGKLADEVRTCNAVQILKVTGADFSGLLPGETQQGDGLQIYPTADTNHFVVYFVNQSDQTFRRATEQAGSAVILADAVTNSLVFSARDLSGQVLTNSQNNEVIHLKLEFYRPKRFMQDSDYYKLETAVTRRALQ